MKKLLNLFLAVLIVLSPIVSVSAQSLGQRLAGNLLLQVEDRGRVWYVSPSDFNRYEVTFKNALPLFEKLSLGITNQDLDRIDFDKIFAQRLQGKLLLQVQDRGRIWYVDFSGKRHEVTWNNLLPLFESLSLGITNANLNAIPQGVLPESSSPNSPVNQNNNGTEEINQSDPTKGSNDFVGALANSELHNFVNDYRIDLGMSALILHEGLCSLVDERIEEIKLDLSHDGFSKQVDDGKYDSFGYRSLGENLFWISRGDEQDAIDGWHNSPGHRENMRGDWTHACSKFVDGYGVTLFMKL